LLRDERVYQTCDPFGISVAQKKTKSRSVVKIFRGEISRFLDELRNRDRQREIWSISQRLLHIFKQFALAVKRSHVHNVAR